MGWIAYLVMLKSVTVAFERNHLFVKRGWLNVQHPAMYDHAVFGFLDTQRRVLGRGLTKAAAMHPSNMRGVQKIVAHQQIVAVQFHRRTAVHPPIGIVEILDLENLLWIGQHRIAHPNPD